MSMSEGLMRRFAAWLRLEGLAVIAGFGLAMAFMLATNAILPPFRREDDDTLREFVPVAIAYAIWGFTTLAGAVFAWRWVSRRS